MYCLSFSTVDVFLCLSLILVYKKVSHRSNPLATSLSCIHIYGVLLAEWILGCNMIVLASKKKGCLAKLS